MTDRDGERGGGAGDDTDADGGAAPGPVRGLLDVPPTSVTVEWPAVLDAETPGYADVCAAIRRTHEAAPGGGAGVVLVYHDPRDGGVHREAHAVRPKYAARAGERHTPLSPGGQVYLRELPHGATGRGDRQFGGHADAVVVAAEVCRPADLATGGAGAEYTDQWAPDEVETLLPRPDAPVAAPIINRMASAPDDREGDGDGGGLPIIPRRSSAPDDREGGSGAPAEDPSPGFESQFSDDGTGDGDGDGDGGGATAEGDDRDGSADAPDPGGPLAPGGGGGGDGGAGPAGAGGGAPTAPDGATPAECLQCGTGRAVAADEFGDPSGDDVPLARVGEVVAADAEVAVVECDRCGEPAAHIRRGAL